MKVNPRPAARMTTMTSLETRTPSKPSRITSSTRNINALGEGGHQSFLEDSEAAEAREALVNSADFIRCESFVVSRGD